MSPEEAVDSLLTVKEKWEFFFSFHQRLTGKAGYIRHDYVYFNKKSECISCVFKSKQYQSAERQRWRVVCTFERNTIPVHLCCFDHYLSAIGLFGLLSSQSNIFTFVVLITIYQLSGSFTLIVLPKSMRWIIAVIS